MNRGLATSAHATEHADDKLANSSQPTVFDPSFRRGQKLMGEGRGRLILPDSVAAGGVRSKLGVLNVCGGASLERRQHDPRVANRSKRCPFEILDRTFKAEVRFHFVRRRSNVSRMSTVCSSTRLGGCSSNRANGETARSTSPSVSRI